MVRQAHAITRLFTAGVVVVLLVTGFAGTATAADHRAAPHLRKRLTRLVNAERAEAGLRRLKVHGRMQRLANGHAREMGARRSLYHDPRLRHEIPPRARSWGENVGYTTDADSATRVHELFMASPGHRKNVLRRKWTHVSIGVKKKDGRTWYVQRFATLR